MDGGLYTVTNDKFKLITTLILLLLLLNITQEFITKLRDRSGCQTWLTKRSCDPDCLSGLGCPVSLSQE